MSFLIKQLKFAGAALIEYFYVGDERGSFGKILEKDIYSDNGIDFNLNETFYSVSQKNVIRGLHFQTHNPQAKVVSVLTGRVYDVIVDLRKDSPTFKKWIGVELGKEKHNALFVPRGFAHGFLSLEDNTTMLYMCDGKYDKETDAGIRFDDPDIGVNWPCDLSAAIHSKRDLELPFLKDGLANGMDVHMCHKKNG